MIKTVQVDSANIVELIRAQMTVVTEENKGLMSPGDFMRRRNVLDANQAIKSGIYFNVTANTPVDYNKYFIIVFSIHPDNDNYVKQIAFPNPDNTLSPLYNRMYIRYKILAGWSEWKEL